MTTLKHRPLIAFAIVSIAIMLLPQHVRELLYLHIEDFKHGEYWRFFSAHITHYSWIHCLSNIIGLLLLMGIFSDVKCKMHWLIVATMTGAAISIGLILFSTQLNWYMGFSGILTGLYAYASIKVLNENIMLAVIILIALAGYITAQLFEGELISSLLLANLKTSSHAHAYGFSAGIIYGLAEQYILSNNTAKNHS